MKPILFVYSIILGLTFRPAPVSPEKPREPVYEVSGVKTQKLHFVVLDPYEGYDRINGYPCGRDLPPCWVLRRESRGNPTAQNPTSTASGLWQFLDGTWGRYKGFAKARHAPWKTQNEKAKLVWAGGKGCSHWSAC